MRSAAFTWLLVCAGIASGQESKPVQDGGYAVVAVALQDVAHPETAAFLDVARDAAKFHRGKLIAFDGQDFDGIERALRHLAPSQVLWVVRPEAFDVNLHRRIVIMSARIDADPFCDFSFGYLTARNGAALAKLWDRTVVLHKKGLANTTWIETAVAPKFDPIVIEGHIPVIAKAAGFTGASCYFAVKEWKNYSFEKVLAHLQRMKEASVISMSGNGDPQGIWLFDDDRNLDRTKHWPYDPAKVGQDPKGEMPRVKAAEFRKLALKSPVIWSGTCHSGATRRVFVEPDIVSTFGRTETVAIYELKPEEGLCLSWIDGGAGALLVPIGANHGMACLLEQDFALGWGATLGDAARSTYDDVMLRSGGKPRVRIKAEGQPLHDGAESPMQANGLNRALIGDPALRPFKATKHPLESVTVTPITPRGVTVAVSWMKGFHAWAWDMYGGRATKGDWRILARVSIDGYMPKGAALPVEATVEVKDDAGAVIPFTLTHAVVEQDHGRLWLHLQANAERKDSQDKSLFATFRARW
jgi:hypothetical protein